MLCLRCLYSIRKQMKWISVSHTGLCHMFTMSASLRAWELCKNVVLGLDWAKLPRISHKSFSLLGVIGSGLLFPVKCWLNLIFFGRVHAIIYSPRPFSQRIFLFTFILFLANLLFCQLLISVPLAMLQAGYRPHFNPAEIKKHAFLVSPKSMVSTPIDFSGGRISLKKSAINFSEPSGWIMCFTGCW